MKSDIINSVDRALEILLTIYENNREMGISELSEQLGIYKSTVFRTLKTMEMCIRDRIESLDDLAGKAVVVQAASAALDALNNDDNKALAESFGSLTENPDYNTAFMNLESGAADAVAIDIGVANYQLSQREEGAFVILDEPIQSEQSGIGFKKGNDALKEAVWEMCI